MPCAPLTTEAAKAIEAIATRRMAWLADRPAKTLFDRQCIAKAHGHHHDIAMAARGVQDHLAGFEGFEACEDELFELIGDDATYAVPNWASVTPVRELA